MAVAKEAKVRPDRGKIIQCRSRHRIVIAAGTDAAAEWVIMIGRDKDRVIRNGRQRGRRCSFRIRERPVCLAKDTWNDTVAHRGLVISPSIACTRQIMSQSL